MMFGIMFSKTKTKKAKKAKKAKDRDEVPNPALLKLNDILLLLDKQQKHMEQKIAEQVRKAKEYSISKNKRAAIMCLKQKKLYEGQLEQLDKFQFKINDQISLLQTAAVTTDTVEALQQGAVTMKNYWKNMNIDDVDKTMDEINEQTENMKQIQEALSQPTGGVEFDEEDLMKELDELEEQAEDLEQGNVSATQNSPIPTPQPENPEQEEQELHHLRAEMAL